MLGKVLQLQAENSSVLTLEDGVIDFSLTSVWLKCLVRFFRVSGVEINYSQLNNGKQRFRNCVLSFGVAALFLNSAMTVWAACTLYANFVKSTIADSNSEHFFAYLGSVLMEYFSITLLSIGVHGLLLVKTCQESWNQLWSKLHIAVQSSCEMGIALRKTAISDIVFLIVVSDLTCILRCFLN